MRILDGAADRADGTVARAHGTAAALVGDDLVFDQVGALARGALLVVDMRLIFIAEVFDGGENRVRGCLAETAERAVLDGIAQLL